uniref:ANK_REP_REGION domain-containing protein n=1 Tax=Glossina austeni TaxID=7395 RepID=A0A1A9VK48_GLOAU
MFQTYMIAALNVIATIIPTPGVLVNNLQSSSFSPCSENNAAAICLASTHTAEEMGYDVDSKDSHGCTSLFCAVIEREPEVLQVLYQHYFQANVESLCRECCINSGDNSLPCCFFISSGAINLASKI